MTCSLHHPAVHFGIEITQHEHNNHAPYISYTCQALVFIHQLFYMRICIRHHVCRNKSPFKRLASFYSFILLSFYSDVWFIINVHQFTIFCSGQKLTAALQYIGHAYEMHREIIITNADVSRIAAFELQFHQACHIHYVYIYTLVYIDRDIKTAAKHQCISDT